MRGSVNIEYTLAKQGCEKLWKFLNEENSHVAALGALTGGALAYGLGKGSSNKEILTVLGIGLGAMMGSSIGAQLDERDRLLAGQSLQTTMETAPDNSAGGWNNPNSGNSGTITPTATTTTTTTGQPCREFTQTVSIGGKQQEAYGTACRQADGSWKTVCKE